MGPDIKLSTVWHKDSSSVFNWVKILAMTSFIPTNVKTMLTEGCSGIKKLENLPNIYLDGRTLKVKL